MNYVKYLSLGLLLGITLDANAYYTQQGQIYDNEGNKVIINGLSWSGFQDTNVFQGLQNNPFYSMTTDSNSIRAGLMDLIVHPGDYADSGVDQQNAVQFKTVRLPIQPGVLYDDQSEVDLNKALSNKEKPESGNGLFCKSWQGNGNACEKAVSPKQAFWIVLEEMKKNNVKVMIDMHHRYGYGDGMRDGTVYDMNQYAKDLTLLANEIKQRGLDNVIGIDVFNEPYQLNWFKGKNNQIAWTQVIATAAKTIHQTNPDLLIFVEGSGGGNDDADNPVICIAKNEVPSSSNGFDHWNDPGNCGDAQEVVSFKGNWGEDFKPLLNKELAKKGIAQFDSDKFTNELYKQVPDLNSNTVDWLLGNDKAGTNGHVVFSPHVYPKEVAGWETEPGIASTLRFDWSWGFLHKAGFPIVLGEASWKSAAGKSFFTQSLMPYLAESGIGTNNVYFWAIGYLGDTVSAINPNSGALDLDVQQTLKPYFN
ncbi:cellulase family glycosylhydrolase [Legionella bononiensis]|uniref:Cellulase family glycosylhydrolase n=1 Tax=Legionella bononiensis TaxID=2793102 RepID=A0ABS1WC47_9GAMM|nr:cellulase family glycosylhydrolase [Legionella bononiensis]MBL7481185.1 cellulase family glycosylhydrolase [Legionella bononiensis]MBL7526894.1 cellulase family glycosylhydrolase [Legionella bononiensis]MBL7563808.1 cellulase family glycosylhydrolase [Legionella bononiensis]